MFDFDLDDPNLAEACAHLESLMAFPLDSHHALETLRRDLQTVASCIDYFCADAILTEEEEVLVDKASANFHEIYTRMDIAARSEEVQAMALADALSRIMKDEDVSSRQDEVLFGFVGSTIVDPAILTLVSKPVPEPLSTVLVDGFRLVRSPRWVYDVICEELDRCNWHSRLQYTAPVPVPTADQVELFGRLLSMMDIEDASIIARTLVP